MRSCPTRSCLFNKINVTLRYQFSKSIIVFFVVVDCLQHRLTHPWVQLLQNLQACVSIQLVSGLGLIPVCPCININNVLRRAFLQLLFLIFNPHNIVLAFNLARLAQYQIAKLLLCFFRILLRIFSLHFSWAYSIGEFYLLLFAGLYSMTRLNFRISSLSNEKGLVDLRFWTLPEAITFI